MHRTARLIDQSARVGLDSGMGSYGTILMIAAASEESHNGLLWALREDGNFGVVASFTLPLSRHWVRTARSSAPLASARNVGGPYGKDRQSEVGDFSESLVVLPFSRSPLAVTGSRWTWS
jgi:hypothetical protein